MIPLALRGLIMLCLLGIETLILVYLGSTAVEPDGFLGALNDKAKLLKQQSISGHRIVLVGGSNLLFGIDSTDLQSKTGYRVVNTSLHAGMGLYYDLWFTGAELTKGDIVILSPEYYCAGEAAPDLLAASLYYYPQGLQFIWQDCKPFGACRVYFQLVQLAVRQSYMKERPVLDTLKHALKRQILNTLFAGDLNGANEAAAPPGSNEVESRASVYLRSSIKNGDMVAHLNQKHEPLKGLGETPPKVSSIDYSEPISRMNSYAAEARKKGARVFFVFPTVCRTFFSDNEQQIDKIRDQLESGLKFPILNTPQSLVYEDRWYFDTTYHLGRTGRSARTKALLHMLQPIVEHNPSTVPEP